MRFYELFARNRDACNIFSTIHFDEIHTQIHAYTQTRIHNGQYITIIINVCCGCTNCVFLMAWLCTTPPQYPLNLGAWKERIGSEGLKEHVRKKVRDRLNESLYHTSNAFSNMISHSSFATEPKSDPRFVDVSIIPPPVNPALYSLYYGRNVPQNSPDYKAKDIEAPLLSFILPPQLLNVACTY